MITTAEVMIKWTAMMLPVQQVALIMEEVAKQQTLELLLGLHC
jgi:hypothetical protein